MKYHELVIFLKNWLYKYCKSSNDYIILSPYVCQKSHIAALEKKRIKIGIIGFGRMGGMHLQALKKSGLWDIAYICDLSEVCRAEASVLAPEAKVTDDEDIVFADPEVEVVSLCALADSRPSQIKKAIRHGKHVMAEKPIGATVEEEMEIVEEFEKSGLLSTVNLYLRNSWYHSAIKEFIDSGEIGDLAVLRVCHLTPGLAPGEGHESEGPSFHDCGMHYVDIARWYAGSDYKTWNAQAVRMWSYKDPWFLQAHGTFENGVVFDITQGHVYGQLSKVQTHNSYIDIICTKGIARMSHDFNTAVVELHGVTRTERIEKPYGGKNIDRMVDRFAESIYQGKLHKDLPTFRDAARASEWSWLFLENAKDNGEPCIGTLDELAEIHRRRREMTNGYGLLNKSKLPQDLKQ